MMFDLVQPVLDANAPRRALVDRSSSFGVVRRAVAHAQHAKRPLVALELLAQTLLVGVALHEKARPKAPTDRRLEYARVTLARDAHFERNRPVDRALEQRSIRVEPARRLGERTIGARHRAQRSLARTVHLRQSLLDAGESGARRALGTLRLALGALVGVDLRLRIAGGVACRHDARLELVVARQLRQTLLGLLQRALLRCELGGATLVLLEQRCAFVLHRAALARQHFEFAHTLLHGVARQLNALFVLVVRIDEILNRVSEIDVKNN